LLQSTQIDPDDFIPDNVEWSWFWSYNIAAVMMFLLCIIHTRLVYQDLFTTGRASVSHRKKKPPLTKEYNALQYWTLATLYFHFGDSFLFGLEMASYSWSHQVCIELNQTGGLFLVLGKGCMYMLLMYRLILCYDGSAFGCNKTVLITIGWLSILYGLIVKAIAHYWSVLYRTYAQDVDEFPNPCFPINDSFYVAFLPVMLQIWDGVMNILSLVLFLYPLRKLHVIGRVEAGLEAGGRSSKNAARWRKGMRYLAIKFSVLTFVAFVTTIWFWSMIHFAPTAYWLVSFDVVINSVCVMLMSAYYPDSSYYERLCCCFLLCCKSYIKDDASMPVQDAVVGSVEMGVPSTAKTDHDNVSTQISTVSQSQ